jgi:ribosomal protein S18 acetylase RimI-like enzyme
MIRRIQFSDWPAIARIQAESYPREVLESLESLQSHWNVSERTCLVAEVQGAVVGYILAHPWLRGKIPPLNEIYSRLPTNCDSLFIHDLALSPSFRGMRIGDGLVEAVFEAGSALGLTHLSLISVQDST